MSKILPELLLKTLGCTVIWVGMFALFGMAEDDLVLAGVVTFCAYGLGFWHGRCP